MMVTSLKGQEALNEVELQLILENSINKCKVYYGKTPKDVETRILCVPWENSSKTLICSFWLIPVPLFFICPTNKVQLALGILLSSLTILEAESRY